MVWPACHYQPAVRHVNQNRSCSFNVQASTRPALAALLLSAAIVCGCSGPRPTDDDLADNGNENEQTIDPNSGAVRGVLTVLPQETRSSVVEQEPNDTVNDAGIAIPIEAGTRLELMGDLSVSNGDRSDSFLVQAGPASTLTVQAVLSFDFNPENPLESNFALGLSDLQSELCSLGVDEQLFSQCVNTERNPEVAAFDFSGTLGLTVQALSGAGSYILGLEFSDASAPLFAGNNTATAVGQHEQVHAGAAPAPSPGNASGELLVKFDRALGKKARLTMIEQHGLEVLQESPSGVYLLRPRAAHQLPPIARMVDTIRIIQAVGAQPGVRVAEPNYRYYPVREPDDEYYSLQWHYDMIYLPDAWDLTVGSSDVTIAVIDTGILADHPDFEGRFIPGFDFISDPDSARDGDGIDDDPTDNGDLSGGPARSSYHGTHVTGTVGAATDNGLFVAGVTWGCRILPLRALGVGGGTSFDIAEAIRYAAQIENVSGELPDDPADVINLSIATPAGSSPSTIMREAIAEAVAQGVVVVAAAGNDNSSLPAYPGGYDEVICVAACDPQLQRAPYSNFGSTIDMVAPGGNLSTEVTGDGQPDGVLSLLGIDIDAQLEFTLSFQHGTSMASPHVAGVVGLMKSVNPGLTVDEVREILAQTALEIDGGTDLGAGLLNAAGAVNEAALRSGQPTPAQPRLSLSAATLDFGTSLDQLTVQVTNTGGGILEIEEVSAETFIDDGWLTAAALSGSGASNISAIEVTVDRTELTTGSYAGRVRVAAAAIADQLIDVQMRVGQDNVVQDLMFVVAIDAQTRITIAQDVTDATRNFAFQISGLPPNRYKIYAGTDRDGDDQICDLGELCGGFPSAIVANEVLIEAGATAADIDFPVGELIFEPQMAQKVAPPVLRILDRSHFRPIE